ncbi:DUF6717 family protein [Mucilaginibacter pedocola]|uniref:Uncharacterized protein n=1 Tax=Mucilaginibacter pedocola TaxID=1792845 RepID=A0A1S9PEK7_9SPHI|nr:DUF6717 family protein [Mucilaginibacter pedocola]OOQ59048.1 hypothetical protein BC343_29900 [Mucilaginibacter pedocola]
MNLITDKQTFLFVKEPDNKWYIDLPDYPGPHADLEMVEGADTMLEYVGKGSPEVKLTLSETPFDGASQLTLKHSYSEETGGGGIYLLADYGGVQLDQEMWLCDVTAWLFGKLPAVIFFKHVS